jgi:hypothetical protein
MPGYDPQMMMQMGRMGLGIAGGGLPFGKQGQTPTQSRPWWDQPRQQAGQSANRPDDPSQLANSPKQPPSLLQMLMAGPLMKKGGLAQQGMQGGQGGQGGSSYGPIPGMGNMNWLAAPEVGQMGLMGGASPWAWLGALGGGGGK